MNTRIGKVSALLGLGALLLVSASPAFAVDPSILFWADNGLRQVIEVPLELGPDGLWRLDNWEYSTRDFSVRVHDVRFDPSRSVAYGIAATAQNGPENFSFTFQGPISIEPNVPNTVTASIVGGLTDFTGDGVSFTPTAGPKVQRSYLYNPYTGMGVDVGDAYSHGPGTPGALYAYNPGLAGPIPGPVGAWTDMELNLDFQLSGNGDIAAMTGYARIDPIPEPATAALLGLGLAVAGLIQHRRRRAH